MNRLVISLGLLIGSLGAVGGLQVRAGTAERPRFAEALVFTQIPVAAVPVGAGESGRALERLLRGELPPASRIVRRDPAGTLHNLTEDFAAAGRPDVSFDGRRILFVARREAGQPLDVWEMTADGSGARQVTHLAGGCSRAIYLSTLFSIDAAAPVPQICFVAEAEEGTTALYTCGLDGAGQRRISFDPGGAGSPCALADGRLLFSCGTSGGEGAVLRVIDTDGTGVSWFAMAPELPSVRAMPCELPDGRVVCVAQGPDPTGARGDLIAISRQRSPGLSALLASDPEGAYLSPAPLPGGGLLVSYLPQDGSAGIDLLDPASGSRVGEVCDTPDWHELSPRSLSERRRPAGRSTSVDEGKRYGFLYGLDAYLSDTPAGRGFQPGGIARLRVHRHATAVGASPEDGGGLIGEVPVEADGSFFLMVPARAPLRLETLDASGVVLQSMQSWLWVMPGESRGCIGCHEDRELTPPNRHALALQRLPHAVGTGEVPAVPTRQRAGPTRRPGKGYR